jgi:hypothetical protein
MHLLRIVLIQQGANGLRGCDLQTLLIPPHVYRLPRTIPGAELAPYAALEIDFDQLHEIGEFGAWDDLDAIDRTESDARLASRASGLVDDRQLFRRPRPRGLVDLDLLAVGKRFRHRLSPERCLNSLEVAAIVAEPSAPKAVAEFSP